MLKKVLKGKPLGRDAREGRLLLHMLLAFCIYFIFHKNHMFKLIFKKYIIGEIEMQSQSPISLSLIAIFTIVVRRENNFIFSLKQIYQK